MPRRLLPRFREDRRLWQAFRHHSRTFSLAARLLPRPVQMPVAVLYLYCRTVDTLADEEVLVLGTDRALERFAALRHALDATLDGRPPPDDEADGYPWRRLAAVHARYDLDPVPLHELMDGARWDLEDRTIETKDDLVTYANLVGGSVGAMMLPFLTEPDDERRHELDAPARALGIAMQITNILRDVGADRRHLGRVYVPTELLHRHGLADALAPDGDPLSAPPAGYHALVEDVAHLAESHYDRAEPAIAALRPPAQAGIRAAARMYREILNEVRERGYDNLSQRAYVPLSRKLRLLLHDDYGRRKAHLIARHALVSPAAGLPTTAPSLSG